MSKAATERAHRSIASKYGGQSFTGHLGRSFQRLAPERWMKGLVGASDILSRCR